jgi:hypothetical protein
MSQVLSGIAVAVVAGWCLLSLGRPWTCAYLPHFWPHKVMAGMALSGVGGLLVLARRRPGLALGLGTLAVAFAAADLVRRWNVNVIWPDVFLRFLQGTVGPLLLGVLLLASSVGWGTLLGRGARWKDLSLPDRLALGILLQALLILGAGSLGLLHPALAWTLVLAGTLASLGALRGDFRTMCQAALPSPVHCLWLAPAVMTILFGTLKALAPEIDGDSLRYHLALPQDYMRSGSTAFRPENSFSLMPAYGQMIHLLSLLLSGNTPSRLLGVAAFVATLRAAFDWARRYDSERLPWIVVGLLGAMVQWRETIGTAMAESYLVLFATLSLHHLAKALEEPDGNRQSLILAGLYAGGVAGSKLFGVLFPILLGLGILITARHRWRAALGFSCLGVLLACPWYLRSALATGNPFWPSFAACFGGDRALLQQNHDLLELLRSQYALTYSWLEFPLLPVYATFHGGNYDVALDPWVVAWLPAALVSRRPAILNAGLWTCLGMAFILYGIYIPLTRYFAVLFPVLALAAGRSMREHATPMMRGVVTASFLAYALATAATHLPAVETALLPVLGFQSREQYPVPWIAGYSVSRHASQVLPPDAKVLIVDVMGPYYVERTVYSTDPTLQHDVLLSQYRDTAEVVDRLRRLGIGYIVAKGKDPFPSIPGGREDIRVIHEADGWSLFALAKSSLH